MPKLYPPVISGTLPGFYLEENGAERFIRITVPFAMNRAVSPVQVKGFALRIKTVQNSTYLYTAEIKNPIYFEMEDSPWATFTIKQSNNKEERNLILNDLKVGLFYKLQLAYIGLDDEIGYFSTVGIAKYTTKPTLYINDFKTGMTNTHKYDYIGFYNQENGDYTEKAYMYRFDVYNDLDELIETSGDQIHNVNTDTELYESYDTFSLNKDLEFNKTYKIKYSVITNNQLTESSPRYRIMQRVTIDPDMKADLTAEVDFDNGYIDIKLVGQKDEDGVENIVTGSFVLTRACEDTNYMKWEEIARFKLGAQFATRDLWRDFTAEQGKNYKYSIQQYNDKQLYSNRIISNIVYSDFEDAFLYDGTRQLKIKYNPKIGNIKTNILEQKTDTLGNKYPFFFRNGSVNYKEFSISGLISYFMDMDNEALFLTQKEFEVKEPTINLIGENLSAERIFKLKVLEWLNDGKPKLFRSPAEGNYIIRLMKVSLSPEDKLGRMLHTFSSTAYEIAECNYENMTKYDFIHVGSEEKKYLRWETIEFAQKDENGKFIYKSGQVLNRHPAYTVRFVDMRPGQIITITFEDERVENIMIGATGSYYIDEGIAIRSIVVDNSNPYLPGSVITTDPYLKGSMTYSYYSIQSNTFDKIADVSVFEVPTEQYIGAHDIIKEIEYVNYNGQWVRNPKIELLEFYHVNVQKRTMENLVYKNGKYYQDAAEAIELLPATADPFTLYKIGSGYTLGPSSTTGNVGYNPGRVQYTFNATNYTDFYNNVDYPLDSYAPTVKINSNIVSVEDIGEFDLHKPGKLTGLTVGNGANAEVSYQVRTIDYLIEEDETYPKLQKAKKLYTTLLNQFNKYYEILSFFNGYDDQETYIEAELALIKSQLQADFDAKKIDYENQKIYLQEVYSKEEELTYTEYLTQKEDLEERIERLENSTWTEQVEKDLFQAKQAYNVLNYEYSQRKIYRKEKLEKDLARIDELIAAAQLEFNEEYANVESKYAEQLKNLQAKKNQLNEECYNMFNFYPDDFTIDKAEYYYNTIEKPMRDDLNKMYANYIYNLVEAQKEEKISEGLS